jgi:hypothetical protein
MDFPLTRERLQKIYQPITEDINEKLTLGYIDTIKNRIIAKAYEDSKGGTINLTHTKSPKFMLKVDIPPSFQNDLRSLLKNPWFHIHMCASMNVKEKLPIILEKLQELFPDVSFQVDPLQTYLLIDWT